MPAFGSTFAVLPWSPPMSRAKSETLTLRTTPEIKELLKMAAEREHRSIASMIEVLILQNAEAKNLVAELDRKSEPKA